MGEYVVGERGPEVLIRPTGMRIVVGWPPNIEAIRARFQISIETVFAWDEVLYVPSGGEVAPEVMAHELVHQRQQREMGGPDAWWARYLTDPAFVLAQEVPAYRRQHMVFCGLHRNRGQQVRHLAELAAALSGPMYGRVVDNRRASLLIKGGKR